MNPILRIRGANYLPMAATSHAVPLAYIGTAGNPGSGFPVVGRDGLFSVTHLRTELDCLRAAGLNNIRLLGSFIGYYISPSGYIDFLRTLCHELHSRSMGLTYQVWTGPVAGHAAVSLTGAATYIVGNSYNNGAVLSAVWTDAESHQTHANAANTPVNQRTVSFWAEPCSSAEWDALGAFSAWAASPLKSAVNEYLGALGRLFNTGIPHRVLDDFDYYNEPDIYYGDATRKANVIAFIKHTHDTIHAQLANPAPCTVGFAGDGNFNAIRAAGVPLTHVSFHCYDRANVDAACAAALAEANGLPCIMSEFMNTQTDPDGTLTEYLDPLVANGIAGQMWCYIQNGHWPPIDGIVIADKAAKLIARKESYNFNLKHPLNDVRLRRWTTQ